MNSANISERRRQTRNKVYRALYDSQEPLSKQALALKLDMSLPTIYQNVTELLDMGLIEYTGSQGSSGGRPAMQMRAVANARYAIGVFISIDSLNFALTNLMCGVLAFKEVRHKLPLFGESFNQYFSSQLESFIDENNIERSKLLGVGICLSGIIQPENMLVFYAPPLNLRNVSIKAFIENIPYPVHVENDANSGGFAEWFNDSSGESIVFLSLAWGVGGATFVNGDKFSGENQRSGEFGHMCIEYNGRPCACGKRGCLEAYCSSSRISSELGMTLDEFFTRLSLGNRELQEIWDDYIKHLAIGVHNIRMALDCRIVIGGEISSFLVPHMPRLCRMVAACDPFAADCDYVSLAKYSGVGAPLGTALHFVKDFLDFNI